MSGDLAPVGSLGVPAAEDGSYLVARLETLNGKRGMSFGGGDAGAVCTDRETHRHPTERNTLTLLANLSLTTVITLPLLRLVSLLSTLDVTVLCVFVLVVLASLRVGE